jgi:hypothetical protein
VGDRRVFLTFPFLFPRGCFRRFLGSLRHPLGSMLDVFNTFLAPCWLRSGIENPPFRYLESTKSTCRQPQETPSSKELALSEATCGNGPLTAPIHSWIDPFPLSFSILFRKRGMRQTHQVIPILSTSRLRRKESVLEPVTWKITHIICVCFFAQAATLVRIPKLLHSERTFQGKSHMPYNLVKAIKH